MHGCTYLFPHNCIHSICMGITIITNVPSGFRHFPRSAMTDVCACECFGVCWCVCVWLCVTVCPHTSGIRTTTYPGDDDNFSKFPDYLKTTQIRWQGPPEDSFPSHRLFIMASFFRCTFMQRSYTKRSTCLV